MSTEFLFDIACDNPAVLVEIRNGLPGAEVEFHSGLGGLEIVGTVVIPGVLLALQAVSLIRELRKKDWPSITVVQVHVYEGNEYHRLGDHGADAAERELSRRIRRHANVVRVVPEIVKDPREVPLPEMIRILFLGANATSTALDLEWELGRIEENLKLSPERDRLELKQVWAVTVDRLTRALLAEAPTIVHFSGHGKAEGIVLRDETGLPSTVPLEALAGLFELFKETVRCVVLNACYSEAQAHAIRRHIPYVIGIRSMVQDKAAIAFSTGFYQALGAGKEVPFAFNLGKQRVLLEGLTGDNDLPILL